MRRVFQAALGWRAGPVAAAQEPLTAFSPESDRPQQERGLRKGRGHVFCVGASAHSQLQPFALSVDFSSIALTRF